MLCKMNDDRQPAMLSSLPFSGVDHNRSMRSLFSILPPNMYRLTLTVLHLNGRDHEMVVMLPSLASAERKQRRCAGVGRICKIRILRPEKEARDFERSVLKYVSIKISALTHSGRKRRVCVNAADRLWQNCKR